MHCSQPGFAPVFFPVCFSMGTISGAESKGAVGKHPPRLKWRLSPEPGGLRERRTVGLVGGSIQADGAYARTARKIIAGQAVFGGFSLRYFASIKNTDYFYEYASRSFATGFAGTKEKRIYRKSQLAIGSITVAGKTVLLLSRLDAETVLYHPRKTSYRDIVARSLYRNCKPR